MFDLQNIKHEQVAITQDPISGLVAIIAVHNSVLGPGLGGCRMQDYPSLESALEDVLRLSEAMTYKNALCGINFGGGKSVIIKDRNFQTGRVELFKRFGLAVQSLCGKYVTAEDMGTTVSDMETISSVTKFVAGRSPEKGGGGDPSPYTALGVFSGIKATLKHLYGSNDCSGKKVAIQGIGQVGFHLAELLVKAGAKVVVTDPRAERMELAKTKLNCEAVGLDEIFSIPCDIFSPCAAGGAINKATIGVLKCKAVAGGANNQIFLPEDERALLKKGILFAPDFAINSGGVLLCAEEYREDGFSKERLTENVKNIEKTIDNILTVAKKDWKPSSEVALKLAKERINKARSSAQQGATRK